MASAVLGAGMRNKLSVNVNNPLATLTIYMAADQASDDLLGKPFKSRLAYPVGTFAIQQEFDSEYVITNLDFVRELLDVPERTVSALEIKCQPGADVRAVKKELAGLLGDDLVIKDQLPAERGFFQGHAAGKMDGLRHRSLMLVLMAFNMVGALWMIVLDKQRAFSILKSMGANDRAVHCIFLGEGLPADGARAGERHRAGPDAVRHSEDLGHRGRSRRGSSSRVTPSPCAWPISCR